MGARPIDDVDKICKINEHECSTVEVMRENRGKKELTLSMIEFKSFKVVSGTSGTSWFF